MENICCTFNPLLDYGSQNFQKSLSALSTVTGLAPKVSPMSPLSFYLTPSAQLGVAGTNAQITTNNNSRQQDTTQGGNNVSAAVSNYNNTNAWDNLLQMLGTLNAPNGAKGVT